MGTRRLAVATALVLISSLANARTGFEQPIVARPEPNVGGSVFAASWNGSEYRVLYTDAANLLLQRLDEVGRKIGPPQLVQQSTYLPSLAIASNGSGTSLAVWMELRPGSPITLSWISPDGRPGPPISIPRSGADWNVGISVASAGDHFLVSWPADDGLYVSRVDPYATSLAKTTRVEKSAWIAPADIAVDGSRILLAWTEFWSTSCWIPEGCWYGASRFLYLTGDGEPASREFDLSEYVEAPLSSSIGDAIPVNVIFPAVVVDPQGTSIYALSDVMWSAKSGSDLFALRRRLFWNLERHDYLAGLGANAYLGGERQLDDIPPLSGLLPRLAAGPRSLIVFRMGDGQIVYEAFALSAFGAQPASPSPLAVSVVPSTAVPRSLKATITWPAGAPDDSYIVEAEALSDISIQKFAGTVPGGMSEGIVDGLQHDVLYAFRVYRQRGAALSAPAVLTMRTDASDLPQSASDFTGFAQGGIATFRWHDTSTNESGFRITACGWSGGGCRTVAELPANSTEIRLPLFSGCNTYSLATFNAKGSTDNWRTVMLCGPKRRRAVER